jgi:hypothetical protein
MAPTTHRETRDQMTAGEIARYGAAGGWFDDMNDFVKGRSRDAVEAAMREVDPSHGRYAHVVRVEGDADGMNWYAMSHHA